jgi:hydrogenase nickel incorporation protein HypB
MCTTCGCGEGDVRIEALEGNETHTHHDHEHHQHHHSHAHHHGDHHHPHEHSTTALHSHAPGVSESRRVQIEQDILAKNNAYADDNRNAFAQLGIFALNLVSSPGSGKTTLLTATINALKNQSDIAVIEGDQQTNRDAERIRETGVPSVQINTGKGCHLDAHMVSHALDKIPLQQGMLLLIENVGNLVCPAAFDLGEAHKVAILSVTEGEDKPIKYPDMFYAADVMVLNKVDLLPYLDFDVEQCIAYARQVNPQIKVMQVSATKGHGMDEWLQWLNSGRQAALRNRAVYESTHAHRHTHAPAR